LPTGEVEAKSLLIRKLSRNPAIGRVLLDYPYPRPARQVPVTAMPLEPIFRVATAVEWPSRLGSIAFA
jgi:hypothetical protein